MFLIQKYTQYKAAQAEQQKRKVTEKELAQLNSKIDKLLSKLDGHEPEIADNQDDECVVCVNAKASMQTYPCGHKVVCRVCFVKTIQMAVAQRLLPLRCVVCRAKILRLKHAFTGPLTTSASQYAIGSGSQWYHVPSASLYSVSSTLSGVSGVSGVSSASSCSSSSSYKTCASSFSSTSLKKRSYAKQGYQPLRTASPSPSRSPTTRSEISTKPSSANAKEEQTKSKPTENVNPEPSITNINTQQNSIGKGKLFQIQEFQREFRNGKAKIVNERKGSAGSQRSGSGSTRIKCARILVNQAHPPHEFGGTQGSNNGRISTGSVSKSSSSSGDNNGFRRAAPPPTSQSCHSFRLSRHDTVAPTPLTSAFRKGSLRAIPDQQQAKSRRPMALSSLDETSDDKH